MNSDFMATNDEQTVLNLIARHQNAHISRSPAEALFAELSTSQKTHLRILLLTPKGLADLQHAAGVRFCKPLPKPGRDLRDPYRKQVLDLRKFRKEGTK